MNFTEAMTSLEEVKQYLLDLLVKLNDEVCLKNDKFGIMVLNAYCALEVSSKTFRPVNDILCFDSGD